MIDFVIFYGVDLSKNDMEKYDNFLFVKDKDNDNLYVFPKYLYIPRNVKSGKMLCKKVFTQNIKLQHQYIINNKNDYIYVNITLKYQNNKNQIKLTRLKKTQNKVLIKNNQEYYVFVPEIFDITKAKISETQKYFASFASCMYFSVMFCEKNNIQIKARDNGYNSFINKYPEFLI